MPERPDDEPTDEKDVLIVLLRHGIAEEHSAEKADTPILSGALRKSVKQGEQYAYDVTIRSPRGLVATVSGVVVMVSGLMAARLILFPVRQLR